ncbi:uncharacterized protein DUF4297 [Paraburkholderia sp. BL18I3N2]|uniref:dsDNA nuclease domain-containing protein n=1 Tax=Paraburkholderia sp. BL18I3N2 TaxID=1938799 RepID=UPI000D0648C5|nr:dsDNA nuclease domain-containing protein [Paraburkholderia sp. BL18I3N2]PRX24101.1 uncharacterized protein DUF4297 [Paraburkholderia sp. BL18I3N2]
MKLHEIKPREQVGRDTLARYKAQTRAAAIAALAILEASSIDRVYCDYHDDFVVRMISKSGFRYKFVQVKTKKKQNANWTINEIFGLKTNIKNHDKQDSNAIRDSFAGKLLLHTVNFLSSCEEVVFLTNINFDDRVEELFLDIQSSAFSDPYAIELVKRFNACFPCSTATLGQEEIYKLLKKLTFEADVEYVKEKDEGFFPFAGQKIFDYSEIDLSHSEARKIIKDLLSLVERKSSGVISDFSEGNIDQQASIGITELLEILTISADAYELLRRGGDLKAVKTASVLQRIMESAGAGKAEVELCARCKTDWDVWLRENRNSINEINIVALNSEIEDVFYSMVAVTGAFRVSKLREHLNVLRSRLVANKLIFDLQDEQLLGALLSILVRIKS